MPPRSRVCTNCRDPGHRATQCPNPRRERKCGGCGETGHVPYECDKRTEWICKRCSGRGHGYWECVQKKRGRTNQAYCPLCNERGHTSSECANTEKWHCETCDGRGHVSTDCPKNQRQEGPLCRGCGEMGHTRARCTRSPCFKCGLIGHITAQCPIKRKRGPQPTAFNSRPTNTPGAPPPEPTPSPTEQSQSGTTAPEAASAHRDAPHTTANDSHDINCSCMLCSLSRKREPQQKPPSKEYPSSRPVPSERTPKDDRTSEGQQVPQAHEASCTCSICKLTGRSKAKTTASESKRAQKENVPPQATGNTHQKPAAGTRTEEKRSPPADVEYSRNQIAMGLWIRGTATLAAGEVVRALRMFDECIAKDPKAAAFVRSRGDAYIVQKQYTLALQDYQRAYSLLKPALPLAAASVVVKIARCHLHVGSHAPALAAVREALAVIPGDADALRLKKRAVAIEDGVEAYRNASARRQWKAAQTAFEACRKAYEDEGAAVPVGIRRWEVETAVAEGRWAGALEASAAVLADHPKSSETMLMRALVLFLTTDLGGAVDQVQQVLKLDPDNTGAKTARSRFKAVMESKQEGNTLFQKGDSAGAIEKWTNALEIVAEEEEEGSGGRIRAILLLNRSRAKLKLGQHPDALKDVNAAGKLDPENVKIVITRARIYVGLELFDTAIQEFKSALADASKLAAGDRQIVQGELDDVEQRAAKERLKVKDYYEILEIDRNCTTAQIRKAFRTQSLKHHPDKGGVAEKFRLVTEAYDTLSDSAKRARYDARLPPKHSSATQSGEPKHTKQQSSPESGTTGTNKSSSSSGFPDPKPGGSHGGGTYGGGENKYRGRNTDPAGGKPPDGYSSTGGGSARPSAHQDYRNSYHRQGTTGFDSSSGFYSHPSNGQSPRPEGARKPASNDGKRSSSGDGTGQSGYSRAGAESKPNSSAHTSGGGTCSSDGAKDKPAAENSSAKPEQESTKSSWWWPFS